MTKSPDVKDRKLSQLHEFKLEEMRCQRSMLRGRKKILFMAKVV